MNSESQSDAQTKDQLLEHFRGITTLSNFVTRVRRGRSPTVFDQVNPVPNKVTFSPNYAGLQALAKLIARDHEVLALAIAGYVVNAQDNNRACLQIAAVAETKDANASIRLGTSRWKEVRNDPSQGLLQDSLPDHLATITDALNDRSEDTLPKLLQYVISGSWKKMQSQMTHWSSLSILYQMSRLAKEELALGWHSITWDFTIGSVPVQYLPFPSDMISSIEAEIISSLRDYGLTEPSTGSFSRILDAEDKAVKDDYSVEDCWELHLLLMGVLILYAELLQRLRESMSLSTFDPESRRTLIKRIITVLTTLQQTTNTALFDQYLDAMSELDEIRYPWPSEAVADFPKCKAFCKFARVFSPDQWMERDDGTIGQIQMDSHGQKGILRGWFRAQVACVSSVSTVLQQRQKIKAERVELRLIDVQRPFEASLPDWESLVDSCDESHRLNRERVKEILNMKLKEEGSSSTYPPVFTGNVHCCVALASLVTNDSSPLERASLKEIAVSESCCPVCWKLLSILRTSFPGIGLNVQRLHNTVYPTTLPSSLPLEVISEMVEYFELYLFRELLELEGSVPCLPSGITNR